MTKMDQEPEPTGEEIRQEIENYKKQTARLTWILMIIAALFIVLGLLLFVPNMMRPW
jgi:hypothetical protein